jgi:hypothetical protein
MSDCQFLTPPKKEKEFQSGGDPSMQMGDFGKARPLIKLQIPQIR